MTLKVLSLIAGAVLCVLRCSSGPYSTPPLGRFAEPLLVDGDLDLARRHAPWILNETASDGGRQDLPTRADFDGDLRGNNDWENFLRFELPPVVYYAVVGTPTHWFLSYHLFHPRDWAAVDLCLHMTHENDGENLQVVVERASGRVILLLTQAHYRGRAHAASGAGFAEADERLDEELVLVDDEGRVTGSGAHPFVVVEECGHGVYALERDDALVAELARGAPRFASRGILLRPARARRRRSRTRSRRPSRRSGPACATASWSATAASSTARCRSRRPSCASTCRATTTAIA